MAWIAEDRRNAAIEKGEALLTDDMKIDLANKHFPRYPTKRACLLPVLHAVQHRYGWIPPQALLEVAEFLEIAPAEVMDTATFYEEYWLKPKGKYLIQVCRSLTCELCASRQITDHLIAKLKIDAGETTPDKRFTLVELECLGACGTAPVALVKEVLHETLTPAKMDEVLDNLPEDPADHKDPTIDWKS
jgi:NADH-quinone oxidoreductase E subunit